MRENTIEAFFALVRAGLWETEVQLASYGEVYFNEILQLAQEQTVVGLVAAGLENVNDVKDPQVLTLQFVGHALQIEKQNEEMNQFIADLVDKMRGEGIYTLLLKGQGVAQCYERPLWRLCGDVDFLLSGEDYKKAKLYLLPLASSVGKESKYGHLGMTITSWVVELHKRLCCSISNRINKVLESVQYDVFMEGNVRCWMDGHTQVFLLGADGDAFYVFVHFLNHFYKGGVGLRQICDWVRLLWKYKDTLNHGLLERRLQNAGVMTEWKAFGAFAVEYLGMPAKAMPFYSSQTKWGRKARRIFDFLMDVGNLGHNRDMSYFNSKPYIVRKTISLGRRMIDLWHHAKIFPIDSLRYFPNIVYYGLRNAARGE